jgi:hypothetical protein
MEDVINTGVRTQPVTTGQDRTEPVSVRPEISTNTDKGQAVSTADTSKYVALLERINEQQAKELDIKNQQIASMLERDRETNILFRGLQTMLAPLLGSGNGELRDKTNSNESTGSL